MVKINFDQPLKDLDGNPIKDLPRNPDKDLTLKTVCINALLGSLPNEQITGEEKLERWENAQIIHKGGEINLTAETIVLLKGRIGKIYGVPVSGQAWQMLEKAKAEKEEVK